MADILNAMPALKWVWALCALAGVVTGIITTACATSDTRWVKRTSRNEAKRIQAWQSLRGEFVALSVQCAFLFVRAWGLTWPTPITADTAVFARNWTIDATILTIFQLILAYNSVMSYHDRRTTIRLLHQHQH